MLVPDNIWWLQNLSPYPQPVLETVTSLGRGSTTRVSIRKGHLTELRRGGRWYGRGFPGPLLSPACRDLEAQALASTTPTCLVSERGLQISEAFLLPSTVAHQEVHSKLLNADTAHGQGQRMCPENVPRRPPPHMDTSRTTPTKLTQLSPPAYTLLTHRQDCCRPTRGLPSGTGKQV